VSLAELGGWPAVLGPLTRGRDLSGEQAAAALTVILQGEATPAQIAAFCVGLRMKGETVAEMAALVDVMVAFADPVVLAEGIDAVDTCGTGGDRTCTINASTVAALVVAGAGGTVCKHGNRSASSRCGSADLLEALGVVIDLGPAGVAACVEEVGMGFCFAPRYHPALRHVGPTRRELGVPTVFNFLGPVANPARVRRQVLGISDPPPSSACWPPTGPSGPWWCTATTGSTSCPPSPPPRCWSCATAPCAPTRSTPWLSA